MDPITLILLGAGAVWGYNRFGKPGEPQKFPPPPRFTAAQVAQFTKTEDGARKFSPEVARQLRGCLTARSVSPMPARPGASAWKVEPLCATKTNAGEAVDAEVAAGRVALASLSSVLLPLGGESPILILFADPSDVARLASPKGHFAVLAEPPSPPATETAATAPLPSQPPADPSPADSEAPAPKNAIVKLPNGRARAGSA